ncbi:RDD family protein [Leucobacter luti]|uniref:RDD family protein n=1 Tax=Leucobacter luti TaxID=340320 RepID=A0A4Q7TIU3_9MICO|nr:RDD family protein [Leucobacter luti]MBL3700394.1 RDD family protein [Leucobacter luti]RZT60565.1 RDD family protein [Leucobacter luti]
MQNSSPQRFGDLEPSKWPGERLGLPESGPRSVARVGSRIMAIIIDWGLAALPAFFLIGGPNATVWNLLFFALIQIVFIPTIGGSLGHRVLGLRVVSIAGGWVGVWRPIVRTVLLCLVIPVLVWDSDQRGFHDKIAGTVLIRSPERS